MSRVPDYPASKEQVERIVLAALAYREAPVPRGPIVERVMASSWKTKWQLVNCLALHIDAAIDEDRDMQVASRHDPYGLLIS